MVNVKTTKDGTLKLSTRKVLVLSFIVGFFSIVANRWEGKQRRKFKKNIKYKTFTTEKLNKLLEDFEILTSCQDPYIENFIKKYPEFEQMHNLWILNSHEYWTLKVEQEIQRRKA